MEASSDVCTACCDGVQTACGSLCVKARLLSLWADHLKRLLMSFVSIWLVVSRSTLLLARAISHELFLASISFPHSFYVTFDDLFCWVMFCFFNVNLKLKFRGQELNSTEPA